MSTSPNLLFILTDQQRYDCLGVHGHRLVKTPNLDRLAAEGTDFTHAFCPTPICTPARASLLTGAWPAQHLCINIPHTEAPRPMRDDLPTWSAIMASQGYQLDYVGRWHVDPDRGPQDYGFHRYIPDWHYVKYREQLGKPIQSLPTGVLSATDTAITPEQSALTWGADRVIDLLRERAAGDAPFVVRWDTLQPHLPCRPPEPYASMIPLDEIEPWPSFGETFEGKPFIQRQQLRTWGVDDWNWSRWAPIVQRYLGEIMLIDAQIGRLLDELERLGLADNTVVVFSTDHGDMCGGHGMVDKHFVMYEDVVRVPLLVRWPGQAPMVNDQFVCNALDLAATFAALADSAGPLPQTFRGVPLHPTVQTGRQDIYAVLHGSPFGMYSQRMVRDRRWKYVWNATAEDELYDLVTDPTELCNLADDSHHADELARLRQRTIDWMSDTQDPLLNGLIRQQLLGRKNTGRCEMTFTEPKTP